MKWFNRLIWFASAPIAILGLLEGTGIYSNPFNWMWYFCFALPFILMFLLMFSQIYENIIAKILAKKGLTGSAKILAISDTLTRLNHQPVLKMELEITIPKTPVYRVEIEKVVSLAAIPQLQPGNVVKVKVDPNNKKRIIFS
jgi:hypothetical protein